MDDENGQAVSRRGVVLAAAATLVSGCSGLTSDSDPGSAPEEGPTTASDATDTQVSTQTPAEDWNASVSLDASKTSMAGEEWIYNGWNVSVEVTDVDGADEVVMVLDQVNVAEGNATRESVVGSEVGARNSRSLLQKGDEVTVYAVRGDERKRIDDISINSSYIAPAEGETEKWADTWRGEPPETEA